MQIRRLAPVDIRSVWATEPYDFTPWLLENADLLSDALGLQVELEDREHKVGTFSLDLIGRVVGSDQVVIVENQFGSTDHIHLGQIMTYAGGTNPAVIIWIAESFREEHRAALDWLNQNTHTDLKFFGIQLGAVTMAGTDVNLVAPRFEVVCKPNDWEKLARQETVACGGGALTPRNALYKRFWERFEVVAKAKKWTNGTAPAANWWTLSSTAPGFSWIVSYMMGGCRSELYIDTGDKRRNEYLLWQLHSREPALTEAYGGDDLIFAYLPDKRASRVDIQRLGPKITDEECWDDVLGWLVDTQERLRKAVALTGGLPVGQPPDGWSLPLVDVDVTTTPLNA